jgi:hypothetical protein
LLPPHAAPADAGAGHKRKRGDDQTAAGGADEGANAPDVPAGQQELAQARGSAVKFLQAFAGLPLADLAADDRAAAAGQLLRELEGEAAANPLLRRMLV